MPVVMHRANSRAPRGKSIFSAGHGHTGGPHDLGKRMSSRKMEQRKGRKGGGRK